MKAKIYTKEEQEMYLKNPFVIDIKYNRFIEYDPVFKLWCVLKKITESSETCRHLFYEAGFPIDLMNQKLPQSRIKDWENNFYRYGVDYFLTNDLGSYLKSGIIKNVKNNYPKLNIFYLEIKNMLEVLYENSKEDRI